jgi:hypothetical protein
MQFSKINVITGWAMALVSTVVYIITLEPTMPFWDCGEFISSVYKLEVGHPPGAPFFMLVGRLFSAGADPSNVAYMINLLSAVCSGLTIMFLFWTITHFAKKFIATPESSYTSGQIAAVIGSGIIGGLIYTFSDTFWFSAVEAEVYAMSSLFTAVVFWAILKWESSTDEGGDLRWIVLIFYLMGLSIGVHLLNLLAIPAICFVYYFKKHEFTKLGFILTGIISLLILGIFQMGIIIYFVKLAGFFERLFVNDFNLPFNSGAITYVLLVVGLLTFGILYSHRKGKVWLNTALLSVSVAILGYTTFATVIVRSQANPPMDENNPENLFALLSYLSREQYGDRPLLTGNYFNTPTNARKPYLDGPPVYVKSYSVIENGSREKRVLSCRTEFEAQQYIAAHSDQSLKLKQEYVESGEKKSSVPNYRKDLSGTFPRMHSNQDGHIAEYKEWSNYQDWNTDRGREKVEANEQQIALYEYAMSYYNQTNGQLPQEIEETDINSVEKKLDRYYAKMVPTVGEEFKFFSNYQIGWMYLRYFMWNFAGRQNDNQSHGEFINGNWISGIDAIDEQRIGSRSQLTDMEKNNKGSNAYYFLPLIIGLIGLVFQMVYKPRDFFVISLLFLLTGIAIVVYLNQTPLQPRERDYAFAGSFYAFAIWIGLGVYAMYHALISITQKQLTTIAGMSIGGAAVVAAVEFLASDTNSFGLSLLFIAFVATALFGLMMVIGKALKGDSLIKGSIPIIVSIPIVLILCSANWDDHSRANRRTGIAMAINYLQSLQKDAIIFTNGDNDTFPLWYAQEVEGIRTDVRVVNLSLLNTDWYIDQMKRRAYDGAPVPFKMPEQKYRQGTRDVLFIDPDKETKGFMSVSEALAIALDDSKAKQNGSSKVAYLPSYKFSIPVDANTKERFRPYLNEGDSLVDAIQWQLVGANGRPKTYITKAQLMVLDLLSNMDWNRPVYFAVTTGGDAYMGLEQYFQLEGLAYRLTPIKHKKSTNPNLDGGVASEIMYENMMTKFQWGNMDRTDIPLNMDENNRRMTTNLRLQFNHLAEQLIAEGKNDLAQNVLKKSLEVMPEKNVPYEHPQIMWQVADMLYQAGDSATALDLSKRLYEIAKQEVAYYNSLDTERQAIISRDVRTQVQIADRLAIMAEEYLPNDPSVKEMNETVGGYLSEFSVPSYRELLKQEEMRKMMIQQQDTLPKKKTIAVPPAIGGQTP